MVSQISRIETEARIECNCNSRPGISWYELNMTVDSARSEPLLDIEGTLARFGGDKKLFAEMAGFLLDDAPKLVADLGRAIAAKDATAVRSRAHALKGLLAGCGGVRAARVAQSLEDAGRSADLSGAGSLFEALSKECNELMVALREFRA
jgi:two-component system, sensor histidine kinase and response regulator